MTRPIPYEPWSDRSPADRWDKRVSCQDCAHIQRNPINSGAAAARCYRNQSSTHYPMAKHYCSAFEPKET